MNDEESEQRLQKPLQGAFSGPPAPLKDIPTRSDVSRQLRLRTATPAAAPTHPQNGIYGKFNETYVGDSFRYCRCPGDPKSRRRKTGASGTSRGSSA